MLTHVESFGSLAQDLVGNIDAAAPQHAQHADGWVVIEQEDTVLLVQDRLRAPISLFIPEDTQEVARRETVIFTVYADADEFRKVDCTDWVSLCHG